MRVSFLILLIACLYSQVSNATPICGSQANDAECPDNKCCSPYGYCGTSDSYCGNGCQSNCDASSSASCPSGCSEHGTCDSGVCTCDSPWSGEDCSVYGTAIESGKEYSDTVTRANWKYYSFSVAEGSTAHVVMTHQEESEDCDIYLNDNDLPNYDQYYWYDITTASVDKLVYLPSGSWYLGVVGFSSSCSYTLSVTLTSGCMCQNGGQCNSRGGCTCDGDHFGTLCEHEVLDVALDTATQGTVAFHEFVYYKFDIDDSKTVNVKLDHAEDGETDLDLYVEMGRFPTIYHSDYFNFTQGSTSELTFDAPSGTVYIGVLAYATKDSEDATFTLTATASSIDGCPNDCSAHGRCSASGCSCETEYEGDICETKSDALELDENYDGYVAANFWNFYKVTAETTSTLRIKVKQNAKDMDCDLYIRADGAPTRLMFDYAEVSQNKNFFIDIEEPMGHEWNLGVFGWADCEYQIQALLKETECDCGEHGTCLHDGSCQCDQGFGGAQCELSCTPMNKLDVIRDEVAPLSWKYYCFEDEKATSMSVLLEEEDSEGLLNLFLDRGSFPTETEYFAADTEESSFHSISLHSSIPAQVSFVIGVAASNLLIHSNATYSLTVYNTPFM